VKTVAVTAVVVSNNTIVAVVLCLLIAVAEALVAAVVTQISSGVSYSSATSTNNALMSPLEQ
jgi:hypothetical protein